MFKDTVPWVTALRRLAIDEDITAVDGQGAVPEMISDQLIGSLLKGLLLSSFFYYLIWTIGLVSLVY